jgi:hypothetical protein
MLLAVSVAGRIVRSYLLLKTVYSSLEAIIQL